MRQPSTPRRLQRPLSGRKVLSMALTSLLFVKMRRNVPFPRSAVVSFRPAYACRLSLRAFVQALCSPGQAFYFSQPVVGPVPPQCLLSAPVAREFDFNTVTIPELQYADAWLPSASHTPLRHLSAASASFLSPFTPELDDPSHGCKARFIVNATIPRCKGNLTCLSNL